MRKLLYLCRRNAIGAALCVLPLLVFVLILTAMTPKQKDAPPPHLYTVDFNGQNDAFKDVRTGQPPTGIYAAGDTVAFTFEMEAYDVSITFYLDGKEFNASYLNEQYGYCYHFVMPEHDVKLTWKTRNLMVE